MWLIVFLFLVLFALILAERVAKTRRKRSITSSLVLALILVICVLGWKADADIMVFYGLSLTCLVGGHLAAGLILRRRAIPPYIPIKSQNRILAIAGGFVAIALVLLMSILIIRDSPSLGRIISWTIATATSIIAFILAPFEQTEVCGKGIWQDGTFHPWEEYKFFRRQTKDTFEVGLATKSWLKKSRLIKLTPPPENREAVQQLLEANLSDLSPIR